MLSNLEKELLKIIQSDFPIELHPYRYIAEKLDISEDEAYEITKNLIDKGIIRRLGATFASDKLNYASTLCAANVPEDKIDLFVEIVNKYPGVTHNYLRRGYYNIWFTFIGKNKEFINEKLDEIFEELFEKEIINLPAKKLFKVKVDLNV